MRGRLCLLTCRLKSWEIDSACCVVPVAPPEARYLVAAHTGCGRDALTRVEAEIGYWPGGLRVVRQSSIERPGRRWRARDADVGRAQGCTDDDVDVIDGLWCQPGCSCSARGEKIGVKAVEVLGPQ